MKKTQQMLATLISLIILTFFVETSWADVCVGDYYISNIDDIAALSGCTEITGDLLIQNTALTDLSELSLLSIVGGSLIIDSNYSLTSLDGLRITSLGRDLSIWGNTSLTSLNGFFRHHLTSLDGDLTIGENDSLTSLNGLENITSIDGRMVIFSNETLTSLSGLENLTTVRRGLFIEENDVLNNFNGLKNLTDAGEALYIIHNPSLTNFCALYNLLFDGDALVITDNTVLSMDTAYALETHLRNNGFTGTANIRDNIGTVQVFCDNDGDTVYDDTDNCPNTANPLQEDVDEDGVGNLCDANTVYGNISWASQSGVTVGLYTTNCGADILGETTTTDLEGDYSFGDLEYGRYLLVASDVDYSFVPVRSWIDIPQAAIQSYDFTMLHTCDSVDRFVDNGDGTITDCRTGLLWLKNANCYGQQTWDEAMPSVARLNSEECGLSDGSTEGEWRLPTKEELQVIGTDPPTTWYSGYPSVTWTIPGAPFVSVQSVYGYWSSTDAYEHDIGTSWYVRCINGYTWSTYENTIGSVWAVRSPN